MAFAACSRAHDKGVRGRIYPHKEVPSVAKKHESANSVKPRAELTLSEADSSSQSFSTNFVLPDNSTPSKEIKFEGTVDFNEQKDKHVLQNNEGMLWVSVDEEWGSDLVSATYTSTDGHSKSYVFYNTSSSHTIVNNDSKWDEVKSERQGVKYELVYSEDNGKDAVSSSDLMDRAVQYQMQAGESKTN